MLLNLVRSPWTIAKGDAKFADMSNEATPFDVTPIDDGAAEHLVDAYEPGPDAGSSVEAKAARMMADDFLLRAYDRADKKAGNPEADALRAEIERRNLNL